MGMPKAKPMGELNFNFNIRIIFVFVLQPIHYLFFALHIYILFENFV
jgi:hypothetical protein